VAKDKAIRESEKLVADLAAITDKVARQKRNLELVEQRIKLLKKGKDDDTHAALEKAVKSAKAALKEIETKLWGPQGEQGISRRRGWVSEVTRGQRSLSASWDAPTQAQVIDLERGRKHVAEAAAGVNEFLAGPMTEFRTALEASGLDLLPDVTPLEVGGGN
jgi:hypothetical protein